MIDIITFVWYNIVGNVLVITGINWRCQFTGLSVSYIYYKY